MALSVQITVPIQSDSYNTYPPDLTIESSSSGVSLTLEDRTIVIDYDDYMKVADLIRGGK